MAITYDRIKGSFVQQLESLGLVSLDQGRHKQLSDAVDGLADNLRKFLSDEQPALVAVKPLAEPAASADDVVEWLPAIELPAGWSFWKVPSTGHGAGRAVFAHYDNVNGTVVAGVAHVKLLTPDAKLIDIQLKPDDGIAAFRESVKFAVEEYTKPPVLNPSPVEPPIFPPGSPISPEPPTKLDEAAIWAERAAAKASAQGDGVTHAD